MHSFIRKTTRGLAIATLFGALTVAQAATSVLGASATSPSVKDSSAAGGWRILDSVGASATIEFLSTASALGASSTSNTNERKLASVGGDVFGRTFDGSHVSQVNGNVNARVDVIGSSYVSDPGNSDAPTYYQASWTSTTSTQGAGSSVFSGTYDPFTLTYGELLAMGLEAGDAIDIFSQASLSASSGIAAGAGESGSYEFEAYFFLNGTRVDLLNINYVRNGASFNTTGSVGSNGNVDVFYLGEDPDNDSLTPGEKLGMGTEIDSDALTAILTENLDSRGRTKCIQGYGFIYRGFIIPEGLDPDDVVFTTHVDTEVQVEVVPEPATIAVMSLGLLALRRRAKQA